MAAEQIETASAAAGAPTALAEIVADRGYHSNQTLIDRHALSVRSYIAEPDRGRRNWAKAPEAQAPVCGNRRRVSGERGRRLMRRRGQYVERSFAHLYDTGGMRRTHLRGHANILKRLLVHAGAFNLGLLMRKAFGRGTPRGLQGRLVDPGALELALGLVIGSLPSCAAFRDSHRRRRVWCGTQRLSFQHAEPRDFHHGLLGEHSRVSKGGRRRWP